MKKKISITPDSIREWLTDKKFKFHENENDFTFNCPLCTDTKTRLGIKKVANEKKKLEVGAWNCFNCNSNGKKFSSLDYAINQKNGVKFKTKDVIKKEDLDGDEEKSSKLKPDFHKRFIKAMVHPKFNVKKYLIEDRKLSEECIEHFELGGRAIFLDKRGRKRNNGEHVAIPYLRDGACVNVKYRALDPATPKEFKWKRETGGMTWIFNDAVIDDFDYDEIIMCHPTGTLIDTGKGQKKIEEIESGVDTVRTHKGRERTITKLRWREVSEEIVSIKPKYYPYDTKLTKEHPVLIAEKNKCSFESWKLTCKPECPRLNKYSTLKCQTDYSEKFIEAGLIDPEKHWLVIPITKATSKIVIPNVFEPNSDFWFMVGYWLGDGSLVKQSFNKLGTINQRAVQFYYSTVEGNRKLSAIQRIKKYLNKNGFTYSTSVNGNENCGVLSVSSKDLHAFLSAYYTDSGEKTIPENVVELDRELQKSMLKGYWYADGHQSFNKNGNQLKISSTSLHLLKQVQKIGLRFGSLPSIHLSRKGGLGIIKGRKVNQKQLFNIVFESEISLFISDSYTENRVGRKNQGHYFLDNGKCYISFEKKYEHYTGKVYNIEVEDDHSYLSNMVTFHNCESEIDAMSLWTLGYKNTIGLTAGAKGFKQSWYERLLRFKRIFLVLDTDGAGQEGARLLARRLGLNRCFNVVLPEDTKDPNDFIKKYDDVAFQGLLDKAVQFDVPAVKSLGTILKDIYRKRFIDNNEDVKGWEFPWLSVQEKTGSIKPGHLVVIAGRPKVGKTTWALDLTRRMAKGKQKVHAGMYSCEMNLDTLGEKLVTQVLPDLEHIDELSQSQILYASQILPTRRMHFYQPTTTDDLELDKVCTLIEEAVTRYGIKVFIFDNLHFLCRDEDEYTAIGKATQAFKLLAEKLRIGMILLTHPRKGDSNKKLRPDDLKGSSSIFQDADLVIMLNREAVDPDDLTEDEQEFFTGSLSPSTEVDVIGRWTPGGRINMYFNEDRALFKDDGADFEKMREFIESKRNAKDKK